VPALKCSRRPKASISNDYLARVYQSVKRNWFAVMPASVELGDKGVVSLQFRILKNGGVPDGEPVTVLALAKNRWIARRSRLFAPPTLLNHCRRPSADRTLSCDLRTTIICSQITLTSETCASTSVGQYSRGFICAYISARPRTSSPLSINSNLSMNLEHATTPLIALIGPTASGKSSLGVWLAEQLGGEVVACDSTQLYCGFDIGTAKPTAGERRGNSSSLD